MQRKVILYIAMSLDGYIATKDHNIDFLSLVEAENEDYGYADFMQNVDTMIWGRKTYDKIQTLGVEIQSAYESKKIYVLSNSRIGSDGNITYFSDIEALINNLKAEEGKTIYCDGGSELVFQLLQHQLLDRLIVSVIPHLLGDGIRLFKDERPEQKLKLKRSISYPSGLIQLWYDKI